MATLMLPAEGEVRQTLTNMLSRQLGAERLTDEPEAVAELTRLCGRLPAAVAIVAARAASHPFFPLADIAAELRNAPRILDIFEHDEPRRGLRAVFSWSYAWAGPGAARLFRLLPQHPAREFTVASIASLAGVGLRPARELVEELARLALLTEHSPGRYTWHELIRAFAEELGEQETEMDRRRARERVVSHFSQSAHRTGQILAGAADLAAMSTPNAARTGRWVAPARRRS